MWRGLSDFWGTTGFSLVTWEMGVMWAVAGLLLWLAIAKNVEPLLLVPLAFGALLGNLPTRGILNGELRPDGVFERASFQLEGRLLVPLPSSLAPDGAAPLAVPARGTDRQLLTVERIQGGLFDFISQGIKLELFPPLIFLGVGALTDFGPLIAMPRTIFLGAAAQLGVFIAFLGSGLLGFTAKQSAAVSIIGGADGPTAIFVCNRLAPELLGAVAVAAYSYMALVPLIQPPILRLLTTQDERLIRMPALRPVSRQEKLLFCLGVMVICILIVPDSSALIAMLMLGNLLRECAVTDRLVKACQNEIVNVLTIFLGVSVGLTMAAESFLAPATLKVIFMGAIAFAISTAGGVLMAKFMNLFTPHHQINPLIGSAGVSAVPMAARVSHNEGQKYDRGNYLLMHAMGPNVAGMIATAVLAGYFISQLGH